MPNVISSTIRLYSYEIIENEFKKKPDASHQVFLRVKKQNSKLGQ